MDKRIKKKIDTIHQHLQLLRQNLAGGNGNPTKRAKSSG